MKRLKAVVLIVVCAGLLLAYAIGFAAPGFDVYHDDGIYLVTAKALAQGAGYRIISLPQPIAQTKYPPLFPLALAAVWKLSPRFPRNIYALKIVPFGFAIAWLWLAFVYLRDKFQSAEPALWLLLLSAASPWVVFNSVTFMSETMFAFFLTAALLLIDRMIQRDRVTPSKVLLAAAAAAAAVLTRTAGLPLFLAGAGALLIRRKTRAALAFFSLASILVSPWWIWGAAHKLAQGSFEAYYSSASYTDTSSILTLAWPIKLRVIANGAAAAIISPGGLMGLLPATPWGLFLSLSLAAIAVHGFLLDARRKITSLHLFVLLYEGMLLVLPWPSARFEGPLLPFLLCFVYLGAVDLVRRIPRLRFPAKVAAWACAMVLLPFAANALVFESRQILRSGTAGFPLEQQKNWPATLSAMRWVSRNTPADAVLVGDDPTIFLLTGRRAIRYFFLDSYAPRYSVPTSPFGTSAQFIDGLLQADVDYAIYSSDEKGQESDIAHRQIENAIADHPSAFAALNNAEIPTYVIYSIDRRKLQAETKP